METPTTQNILATAYTKIFHIYSKCFNDIDTNLENAPVFMCPVYISN